MTKIGDERIAFYLENRPQIDEWARLKTEAADAVYAVFQEMGEEFEAVVSELVGAPEVLPFLDGSFPAYALMERSWSTFEPDRRPLVAVTLEMHRGELFSGENVPKIYVGIRVERSAPGATELHGAVVAASAGLRFSAKRPLAAWPCWRYVPQRTERWWEDRQAFDRTLKEALVTAWQVLAPVVVKALEGVNAASIDPVT